MASGDTKTMVNIVVDGTYRQTNLMNESPEYLAKREELRLAEVELMRQRERVAELRRHRPTPSYLAPHGPHPAGAWELVHQS